MPLSQMSNGDWVNTGDTVIKQDTTLNLPNGTTFTNNGTLDVSKAHLTIDASDSSGNVDLGMINNGLMIAEKGGSISFSSGVSGNGTIEVNKGSSIYLRTETSSGDIELNGGTLQFGGSNEFYGTITEMTKGSAIELLGSGAGGSPFSIASISLTQVKTGLEQLTAYNQSGGGAFTGLIDGNFIPADFRITNGINSFITLDHA